MIRALTVLASISRDAEPYGRTRIAGVDALVVRPRRETAPVVVFANACTAAGVEQPAVRRLLRGLARAGFTAIAPELPNLRAGEVTPATVGALVAVARASGPRVTLVGASTGAGLAVLAAGDPRLAHRVDAILAIAPFASLELMLRLATTGFYGDRPYLAAPLVADTIVRSLTATAAGDPALPALLSNRDPNRFDDLFSALDVTTRELVAEMSPVSRMGRIAAPVELLADPNDAFFPVEESYELARAGMEVRLTVTPALEHVRPRLRPGLVQVVTALERTLSRAARGECSPLLPPAPAT